MGFVKEYFGHDPAAPPPLKAKIGRRVRFEEVDMLKIVWHGRYVSFLDDGRIAFGDLYPAISYQRFREERIAAPLVQMHIDYQSPLFFDEEMTIEASLHWSDALRLDFEYRIIGPDNRLAARAWTVQLFTDLKGKILLVPPGWLEEFRLQWSEGELA